MKPLNDWTHVPVNIYLWIWTAKLIWNRRKFPSPWSTWRCRPSRNCSSGRRGTTPRVASKTENFSGKQPAARKSETIHQFQELYHQKTSVTLAIRSSSFNFQHRSTKACPFILGQLFCFAKFPKRATSVTYRLALRSKLTLRSKITLLQAN